MLIKKTNHDELFARGIGIKAGFGIKTVLALSLLFCLLLVPSLIIPNLWAEEERPPIYFKFIGNEAFRFSDGKMTLFSDFPYQSGAYGYMEYEYDFAAEKGPVVSLITHRHLDHFDPERFIELEWKIIGPKEVTERHSRLKVIPLKPEINFANLKITPRVTDHSNTEHLSYLVEWWGKKFYFTGDANEADSLKDLPELDILFISPRFYHSAQKANMLPKAGKVIIYHHETGEIVPGCKGCIIPEQGEEFIVK